MSIFLNTLSLNFVDRLLFLCLLVFLITWVIGLLFFLMLLTDQDIFLFKLIQSISILCSIFVMNNYCFVGLNVFVYFRCKDIKFSYIFIRIRIEYKEDLNRVHRFWKKEKWKRRTAWPAKFLEKVMWAAVGYKFPYKPKEKKKNLSNGRNTNEKYLKITEILLC